MSSTATPTLSNGQGSTKMPTAMENKNLVGVRQATPDSDAVVSSDEDHEPSAVMSMSMHSAKSMPTANRPIRRPSWLSEVHSTQRKYSLGGVSLASGGGSQPPTPSVENGAASNYPHGLLNSSGAHGGPPGTGLNTVSSAQSWDSLSNSSNLNSMTNSGRPGTGHSNSSSSFAWNSQLWQQPQQLQSAPHQPSMQKGLPAHAPRWSSSSVSLDPSHPSPSSSVLPPQLQHYHLTSPTSSIHEDLRSPSSSSIVPDHLSSTGPSSSLPFEIPLEPNRKTIRSQSYSSGLKRSALARRSSRPTIYNMDIPHDDSNLYEVDEDESASPDVWGHSPLVTTTTTVSNPATADAGSQDETGNTLPSFSPAQSSQSPSATHSHPHPAAPFAQGSSPIAAKHVPHGRSHRDASSDEPEPLDTYGEEMVAVGTQRAAEHAQSTLANAEQLAVQAALRAVGNVDQRKKPGRTQQAGETYGYGGSGSPQMRRLNPTNYLPGLGQNPQSFDNSVPRHSNLHSDTTGPTNQPLQSPQYFSNDIPRRDGGAPENASPHFWRALYLVSFKSSRSEIFMVPENSNIDPEVGDMVIVDGDRGQDMGIVKLSKLTWDQAKSHKAEYNRRHYKSLVMFSRMFPHVAAAANSDSEFSESTDAIAASNLASPRGRKEADASVPKLIKRIASEQEIKLLRDKEGNEAKAKRICQTKVNQHGIHMEILDAEFQLDYKKLTFYFYAEQYINFNDLVTELFKIWKLRIWLSAVNPASYPEQKTRSRGHRLRSEAALAATASPTAPNDGHETGYPYQVYSPASNPAMVHNPYANINHSTYGGAFTNPNAYMQSHATSFGNNFPANAENSIMSTYFGSSAGPTGMPNQQQWNSFAGHPSGDYSGSGPGSSSNPGQSLAGFAGATPFVPGRAPGFGMGSPDSARNMSSKGRQISVGSMSTLNDESAEQRKHGYRPKFNHLPPRTQPQQNAWPSFAQHAPPGINTNPSLPSAGQMPRVSPWTFGDFNPNLPNAAPGAHSQQMSNAQLAGDMLPQQFGAMNFRDDGEN